MLRLPARLCRSWLLFACLIAFLAPALPGPVASPAWHALSPKERREIFEKSWKAIRDHFYDPQFHGISWEAVHSRYAPLVQAASDDSEFYRLMKQMAGELHDSHTRFNTPTEWEYRRKHEGVSLGFGIDEVDGKTAVISVREGSDAEKLGVRPGMVIAEVNGEPLDTLIAEARATLISSSSERADRLHLYQQLFGGADHTHIKVGLLKSDGSKLDVTIDRQSITNPPTVLARILPSGTAYIRFDEFQASIRKDLREAVEKLRDAPGLIIDLRRNGGGDLGTLMPLAGYFFPKRTIFAKDRTRDGKPLSQFGGLFKLDLDLYAGREGQQLFSGPVVILVSSRTASASEIFAGGMQDTRRARVIGSQTCGCVVGIVKPHEMKGGGVLEIGEILWLTPSGRRLEGEGVIPDKEVHPTLADLEQNRDAALRQAEIALREMGLEQRASTGAATNSTRPR
jgi:carboxyl-terminal processing protease